jgi:hypothetical protein
MRNTIIAIAAVCIALAAVGQVAKTKPYRNNNLGFELLYASTYHAAQLPQWKAASQGARSLLYVSTGVGRNEGSIQITLYTEPFNLERLQSTNGHNGVEHPDVIQIDGHTFYFYGGGGTGIANPDDYYCNLNGHILQISFDGPYVDSSVPTKETRQVETRVLESFRLRGISQSTR